MSKLRYIFKVARSLAEMIFNNQEVQTKDLGDFFKEEEKQEILNRLQSKKEQEERTYLLDKIDLEEDLKKIQRKVHSVSRIYRLKKYGSIAAIFVIGFGLVYLNNLKRPSLTKLVAVNTQPQEIRLKLADGNIEVIKDNGDRKIYDRKGKVVGLKEGTSLNYTSTNLNNTKELMYNELQVPNGKTFQIILSDGTKVHLNSGTTLRYPAKFLKGKERKVFLIGEAFFDVSKDKNHPFIVKSNALNVRVLGTQFNVSSYPEDIKVNTVLLEGSVALYDTDVYKKDQATLLTPGKKGAYSKNNKSISVKKVNPLLFVGWRKGGIGFNHLDFKKIIKKLERHYSLKIHNTNKKLEKQVFTATFNGETIKDVLESFKANFPFEYKIRGNEIFIN